jgi:ferredoxin-NADP reductase
MMKYELVSIEKVGEYKIFRFFPLEEKITFIPGQFVKVSYKDIGRPYSIASSPSWPYIEILVHIINGTFTSILDKVEVNEVFDISKATGHFTYENQDNIVFIAGGAGIAPIMSIIRHIVENKIKGDFKLFYSTRSLKNTPYLSELISYSKAGFIKLFHTVTQEQKSYYPFGRFNKDLVKKYCDEKTTIYLCGSKSLADEFMELRNYYKMKIEAWG